MIRVPSAGSSDDEGPACVVLIERTDRRNRNFRVAASYHPQAGPGVLDEFVKQFSHDPSPENFDAFLQAYVTQVLRADIIRRRAQAAERKELDEVRRNMVPWTGNKRKIR